MIRKFTLLIITLIVVKNTVQSQPAIQWQKSYGGSGADLASSITPTRDGGYIIAGHTASYNGDITFNHGSDDCWVVKVNSSGSIEWQKSYGGSYYDEPVSIKQTNDNGYI